MVKKLIFTTLFLIAFILGGIFFSTISVIAYTNYRANLNLFVLTTFFYYSKYSEIAEWIYKLSDHVIMFIYLLLSFLYIARNLEKSQRSNQTSLRKFALILLIIFDIFIFINLPSIAWIGIIQFIGHTGFLFVIILKKVWLKKIHKLKEK